MNNSPAHILVVDDEALNRILLQTALEEAGHQVTTVTSGEEALDMLFQANFDLVLLDLIMPGLDGFQVLQQMKEHDQLQQIPVLIVSALESMDSTIRCIEMGAIDYLPKPFDPVFLKARINASLAAKRFNDMQQVYAQELRERNEELDAFAHMVAHDLKSPLTLMVGYVQYLQAKYGESFSAEVQEGLNYIDEGARKAGKLINELLMMAQLRHTEVKQMPLDTEKILYDVLTRLQPMVVEYRGVIMKPEVWPTAWGHAGWVEAVWTNYISNGLKYGGDSPQLNLGATAEGDGFVRFWVKDQGSGLTAEQQQQLFQPFTRLHKEAIAGHGLGLSIVRRIITKLGGEVGMESEVGMGSTFWFTLPEKEKVLEQ